MAGGRKEVDPEARRIFNRLTAQAVTLGFGNAVERARKKNEAEAPGGGEEWTTMETAPKEKSETALDKQGGPVVKKGPAPDL